MRSAHFVRHSELSINIRTGHPPILRLPNRQHHTVVTGRLLLLCVLHRTDLSCEHLYHAHRYKEGKADSTTERPVHLLYAYRLSLGCANCPVLHVL
jgi:hypothetical protein